MEAANAALAQMEANSAKYEPLNDAFLSFNAMLTDQMKRWVWNAALSRY